MQTPSLQYHVMSGPDFDGVTMRSKEFASHPLWGLANPSLKYFYQRSVLASLRGEDQRVLILCVTPMTKAKRTRNDHPDARLRAVGMLELEVAPNEPDLMWFKYLSVAPELQRQGIAKQLLQRMVTVMQETPRTLQRSQASNEGEEKIRDYIDQLLDEHNIEWRQTGRSKGLTP